MKEEKQYLVEEISSHLAKSDYVYLANYDQITVAETSELRQSLSEHTAEFHVVKNRLFGVAVQSRELPELSADWLTGPTAIIVGGDSPSNVAKTLLSFGKSKSKLEVKGGIIGKQLITADEIRQISKLPSIDVLRAQLIGILSAPAQRFVNLLSAIPQQILNVLLTHSKQKND